MTIIRERLTSVAGKFDQIDVALFTTFNFNADFFEQNVLPALFGVDETASRAVRAYEVNKALAKTDVGVFYDPSVASLTGKPCRYTHYPVFIQGALFHAKNIFLIGKKDNKRWLYVATLSGNLTLSGWGRNCEVIADTWIHCSNEQPWQALSDYLAWLQKQLSTVGKTDTPLVRAIKLMSDGIYTRRTLDDPEGHSWKSKQEQRLYFSPLHGSLWEFLGKGYGGVSRVDIAAPYWGTPAHCLAEMKKQIDLDDDISITLVLAHLPPAMQITGLGKDDAKELSAEWKKKLQCHVWKNEAGRLHHLKAYRFETDSGVVSAVGSCNFSEPGLFWRRKHGKGKAGSVSGNVEAMMLDKDAGISWETVQASERDFAPASKADDAPEPWPFHVLVFYDWKTETFSWSVKGDIGETAPVLSFSGRQIMLADNAREGSKKGKLTSGLYTVKLTGKVAGTVVDMSGCVIELNLQESTREYTAPLPADAILQSWLQGAVAEPLPPGLDDEEQVLTGEDDLPGASAINADEDPAPLFEFFDFYRAVRQLGLRLESLADNEYAQADLLLFRSDSVAGLASVILQSSHDPAIKYLVLMECLLLISRCRLCSPAAYKKQKACNKRLFRECGKLREIVKHSLRQEMGQLDEERLEALMQWYDKEFKRS